jgi:hypothetical protein
VTDEMGERVHRICPTCTCEPQDALVAYPPNELLYGCCLNCETVRWATDFWAKNRGKPVRRYHCDCCPPDCEGHLKWQR